MHIMVGTERVGFKNHAFCDFCDDHKFRQNEVLLCVFSYSQKVSKNEKEGRTISLLSGSQQMLFFSFLLCSGDETDQSQSVTVTLIQSHSWQKRETEISQYVKLIWPQKVIYKFLSQQRFIIDRSIILSTCCLKQISSVCNSSEEISSETP